MGYKFNPFTGNFDESGTVSIPDPLTVNNLTVNTLLTAAHIHGDVAGSLYIHVKNTSNVTLAKGTPVYAVGAVGDTTTLEIAAADSADTNKVPAIGILKEELAHNAFGHAVMFGEIGGINTGSYQINDELFLAAGGGLTAAKPASGYIQSLAVVGRVHASTGTILVWTASRVQEAGGSTTQIQFNDGGNLAGDVDLTYNKTTNVLTNKGDINLDDGGSFTTTLQTITPTANRILSLPDATGTIALVAGSSGQLVWNSSGAYAGASTLTYDGSILTTSGRFINSYNATASSPAKAFTGSWFTGGTATTTKPQVLIEPTGTTSTGWSTSGTGLGVNAASGFAGRLLDLQVNGTSQFSVSSAGAVTATSIAGAAASQFLPTTFTAGTISYAATTDLDMAALAGGYRTISLTGNITFTTSNRASGRTVVIRVICDSTQRTLTFPAGWVFVGSKPANIAASKTAVLSLTFFGTADTDCVAAYGVQL